MLLQIAVFSFFLKNIYSSGFIMFYGTWRLRCVVCDLMLRHVDFLVVVCGLSTCGLGTPEHVGFSSYCMWA